MPIYIFPPPKQPALPIFGSDALYPVRRMFCVGRNYAAHAVEMGHDPDKEPPFFFQKSPDTIILQGEAFPYPDKSEDVHFEVEHVIALGRGGRNIETGNALNHIFGYAVGLDMTRRDLQNNAKKAGRPWEVGKSFDKSAPMSPIRTVADRGHPEQGAVWLDVNGKRRQSGDLNQMIWKTPEVIAHLSSLFSIEAGDLIMTGTPAGVGPVQRGDVMTGGVEGIAEISFPVL